MRADNDLHSLYLSACGCKIRIDCNDLIAQQLIFAAFGALAVETVCENPDISIRVEFDSARSGFVVHRKNLPPEFARDQADLLYVVDKELIVGLQHHRATLFFLHAAVVEYRNKAVMLAAPSGTGKSTLAWFLLSQGFRYLSDELAPIEVDTLRVHPYPRALYLKAEPTTPPLGEAHTLRTETSIHIPAANLPGGAVLDILPLAAIFFLERNNPSQSVITNRLGATMSAARLMNNTLNALAHPGEGLDTAVYLAQRIPAYVLDISDMSRAHSAIVDVEPMAGARTAPARPASPGTCETKTGG